MHTKNRNSGLFMGKDPAMINARHSRQLVLFFYRGFVGYRCRIGCMFNKDRLQHPTLREDTLNYGRSEGRR